MISPELMTDIRNDLDRWETPILWMYLDSMGFVTVGCGSMLPTAAAASSVVFFHDKTLKRAAPAEVEVAWKHLQSISKTQKLATMHKKFSANHYKNETDLRITIATSALLRDLHIQTDYQSLKLIYADFDNFPDAAKLALFDMIYNLGAGQAKTKHVRSTGLRHFVNMNMAITKGDWAAAARGCSRNGIPFERNKMTAELFKSCVSSQTAKQPSAKAQTKE